MHRPLSVVPPPRIRLAWQALLTAVLSAVGLAVPTGTYALSVQADASLSTPSVVSYNSALDEYVISGGSRRGDALFHSLISFSFNTGAKARFVQSPGINSIFARVTGPGRSQINGLVGANGAADLYFIHPAGITFGASATLGVGGDFVASTARGLIFSGFLFDAITANDAPPLAAVAGQPVPDLLFPADPEKILNDGVLSVQDGKRLLLADSPSSPPPGPSVPGPLPLMGAAAAFRISRRIRGCLRKPNTIRDAAVSMKC